jgi:hypothetical protein
MTTQPDERIVHHYAPCIYIPSIFESGCLIPSNAGAPDETPLLWFSSNQNWEATASKMVSDGCGNLRTLTFAEQLAEFGCCRFSMLASKYPLMTWREACSFVGTSKDVRRSMEEVTRRLYAKPSEWFATPDAISVAELEFSIHLEGSWQRTDLADWARQLREELPEEYSAASGT